MFFNFLIQSQYLKFIFKEQDDKILNIHPHKTIKSQIYFTRLCSNKYFNAGERFRALTSYSITRCLYSSRS